jgi:hypothetical protein
MNERTWLEVMEAFTARGKASSQERLRSAFRRRSAAYGADGGANLIDGHALVGNSIGIVIERPVP